jgi:hypothetical protein
VLDTGTDKARPNVAALKNNNNFRHDIARYQEDLREGRHDPEWIRQAQAAHRKRALGIYDEYLAARFEEDWGMQMPSEMTPQIKQEGGFPLSRADPARTPAPSDPGHAGLRGERGTSTVDVVEPTDPVAYTQAQPIEQSAIDPGASFLANSRDSISEAQAAEATAQLPQRLSPSKAPTSEPIVQQQDEGVAEDGLYTEMIFEPVEIADPRQTPRDAPDAANR